MEEKELHAQREHLGAYLNVIMAHKTVFRPWDLVRTLLQNPSEVNQCGLMDQKRNNHLESQALRVLDDPETN